MQIKFTTRQDAVTFVQNAGVTDWEWSGSASAEGFTDWLYTHRDAADTDDCTAELREYLASAGSDPADYGL